MIGVQADTDDGRPEPGGVRLVEPIGRERHENARLLFDAGPRRAEYVAAVRYDPVLLDEPRVV